MVKAKKILLAFLISVLFLPGFYSPNIIKQADAFVNWTSYGKYGSLITVNINTKIYMNIFLDGKEVLETQGAAVQTISNDSQKWEILVFQNENEETSHKIKVQSPTENYFTQNPQEKTVSISNWKDTSQANFIQDFPAGGSLNFTFTLNPNYQPDNSLPQENNGNPNVDPNNSSSGGVDSGGRFLVQCPTADVLRNEDISGGTYALSIHYEVEFQPRDSEYINKGILAVRNVSENTMAEERDLGMNKVEEASGDRVVSFYVDKTYTYNLVLTIYKTEGGPDSLQGTIFSNACKIRVSSTNPDENISEDAGSAGPEEAQTIGGSSPCLQKCPGITDPIGYAVCKFQCIVIDWESSIITYVVNHLLMPALGLGVPEPTNT